MSFIVLIFLVFFPKKINSFLHNLNSGLLGSTSRVHIQGETVFPFTDSKFDMMNALPRHLKATTALFSSSEKGKKMDVYAMMKKGTGDNLFENINVVSTLTGETSSLSSLLSSTQPTVVCWFTHMVSIEGCG